MKEEMIEKSWAKEWLAGLKERLVVMTGTINALKCANKAKDELTDALMFDIEQLKKDNLRLRNLIRIFQLKDP